MPESVYLDTTIPSFHCDKRQDIVIQVRRQATRDWWEGPRLRFETYSSLFALEELRRGAPSWQDSAIALMEEIELLDVPEELTAIVETYVMDKVMPDDALGDAAHLGMASWHRMDYMLTWNLKHLANVHKIRHIRIINSRMGLVTPEIVTPDYFLGEETHP